MKSIITTTQVQQKIGKISEEIVENSYVVTNRGLAKIVMLPYFDGCDDFIDDYMEEFEIIKNRNKLQKELKESLKSGKSSLQI